MGPNKTVNNHLHSHSSSLKLINLSRKYLNSSSASSLSTGTNTACEIKHFKHAALMQDHHMWSPE